MDERDMTTGVIPVRHASLPGHVKLPRRYEKAAMGTNGIPARVRKISIQQGQNSLRESLSERMEDLMGAIMWVKQELIELRQHDILLKRQFFNIQDSIQSLQKHRPSATSSTSSSQTITNGCPNATNGTHNHKSSTSSALSCNGSTSSGEGHSSTMERIQESDESYFSLDTYIVRPSSSVTMLHDDSCEEEEDDTFSEDFFVRPRTSSMRTSRDMAALARRRGSKELI